VLGKLKKWEKMTKVKSCEKCNEVSTSDSEKFCCKCGDKLVEMKKCKCGHYLWQRFIYCPVCGREK